MMRYVLFALISLFILILTSCNFFRSNIGERYHNTLDIPVKDTTYKGKTSNYDFRLHTEIDNERNVCEGLTIEVLSISKTYSSFINKEPPMMLTIEDTDCYEPFDIEIIRVTYDDKPSRTLMHREIIEFKNKNNNIFYELNNFLFEKGIIGN